MPTHPQTEQTARYKIHCLTCGYKVTNLNDLEFIESLAEKHVHLTVSHQVRVSMDLRDIEIRIVKDTSRDMGELPRGA